MNSAELIKTSALEAWRAPDGLMRLDLEDDKPPFEGSQLRTVRNENGILFLTVFYFFLNRLNALEPTDKSSFELTVKRLENGPGDYNRNPGNTQRDEAHDNPDAICAGSALFKTEHAAECVNFGLVHGYSYRNQKDKSWSLRHLLQGGNIAFRKICAGYVPYPTNYLWFLAGIIVNAFTSDKPQSSHVSDTQLAWVRIEAVTVALENGRAKMPTWMRLGFITTRLIWNWRKEKKFGKKEAWTLRYYRPGHPVNALSALLK